MYRLTNIDQCAMTRWVELLNLETGTVESCFDDSQLVSDTNFSFMKIGEVYNCGIELFGQQVDAFCEDASLCRIKCREVIGMKAMIKIAVGEDEYYVRESELTDTSIGAEIYYSYTRKDLIRVNTIVHADLFRF